MRDMRAVVLAASAAAVLVFLSGPNGTWRGGWTGRAEGATSSEQRTDSAGTAVGSRLHDGAKDFGEGLLGGIKFVGRTIISPFTGTTGKVSRDADRRGSGFTGREGIRRGVADGLKYTGRKVGSFFSESDGKGGR